MKMLLCLLMSFCILVPPTIHAKAMEPEKPAPEKIAYLTAEAIILLHDISEMENTVKALPAIIEGLKKQGFQFKVVSEKTKRVHF